MVLFKKRRKYLPPKNKSKNLDFSTFGCLLFKKNCVFQILTNVEKRALVSCFSLKQLDV